MTGRQVTDSRLASRGARVIADAYRDLSREFDSVTARARNRFEERDWQGVAGDALERLHLYSPTARDTASEVERILEGRSKDKEIWASMKAVYSGSVSYTHLTLPTIYSV